MGSGRKWAVLCLVTANAWCVGWRATRGARKAGSEPRRHQEGGATHLHELEIMRQNWLSESHVGASSARESLAARGGEAQRDRHLAGRQPIPDALRGHVNSLPFGRDGIRRHSGPSPLQPILQPHPQPRLRRAGAAAHSASRDPCARAGDVGQRGRPRMVGTDSGHASATLYSARSVVQPNGPVARQVELADRPDCRRQDRRAVRLHRGPIDQAAGSVDRRADGSMEVLQMRNAFDAYRPSVERTSSSAS